MSSLSAEDARRIVLAAQGFAKRPPRAGLAAVRGLVERLQVVQVDSVNVVCRSQELPIWARLGPHPRDALPQLCRDRVLFEYWAHEASLLPVELQPFLRWRMAEARDKAWRGLRKLARRQPGYLEAVKAEVHARGQLLARDLEPTTKRKAKSASWWSWDDRKRALAFLFWAGEITAIRSPTTFERVYAPWDRVLPAAVLAAPTPTVADAQKQLLLRSARALGVGTAKDLADYFRINIVRARPLLAELVEANQLTKLTIEGWREPGYTHAVPRPRASTARALLSPFDSLIWERARTERLFGFRYRIEIYTPAAKRTHGYYVLPFLYDGALVARVDLKADRDAGALLVQASHVEPSAPADATPALAAELASFARWLGLHRVAVGPRGNLARALRAATRP